MGESNQGLSGLVVLSMQQSVFIERSRIAVGR